MKMKRRLMRIFSVWASVFVLVVSLLAPAQVVKAADSDFPWQYVKQAFSDYLIGSRNDLYRYEDSSADWYQNYLLKGLMNQNVQYYNKVDQIYDRVNQIYLEDLSNTSSAGYNYYFTGLSDNSTTNKYSVFNENNYNFQWYDPINNYYNTVNDFYYYQDYNTYYYQVTDASYTYDYYTVDNSTNVTYYIVQTDTSTGTEYEFYYEIYYQLPDGRNSYNLTSDDVWGEYFVYNIMPYDSVAEDDGKTLGLWHLDGNGNDSSYWNNSTAMFGNITYSEGLYGMGKHSGTDTSTTYKLYLDNCDFDSTSAFTLEWVEFMPVHDSATLSNGDIGYYYNYFLFTGGRYSKAAQDDAFNTFALVYDGSSYTFYVNGVESSFSTYNVDYGSVSVNCGFNISNDSITWSPFEMCYYEGTDYNSTTGAVIDYRDYVRMHYNTIIDEIRLSEGALYTGAYVPSAEPFTTNNVLVIPEEAEEGDILIFSNYDVAGFRIGGARPTYPTDTYVFIALDDDDVVESVQQYQVNKWVEVSARVYLGNDTTEDLVGYDMSTFTISDSDSSSDDSDSSGSGSSSDDSSDSDTLNKLLEGIEELFDSLGSILATAMNSISEFLTSALESLSIFTDFAAGFSTFLAQAFVFIPSEIWAIIGSGLTLVIIAAIIKIIRG